MNKDLINDIKQTLLYTLNVSDEEATLASDYVYEFLIKNYSIEQLERNEIALEA